MPLLSSAFLMLSKVGVFFPAFRIPGLLDVLGGIEVVCKLLSFLKLLLEFLLALEYYRILMRR